MLLFSLLIAGTSAASIELSGDTAPSEENPGDTGGAEDTAPTDSGNDSAGGDTASDPDSVAGDYVGTVEGELTSDGGGRDSWSMTCSGDATFTLDDGGRLHGDAQCRSREGQDLQGPIDGTVVDGVIAASWSIDAGRDTIDLSLDGTVADGRLLLSADTEISGAQVQVSIEARR